MKIISDQRVGILAHDGVNQRELTVTREILEKAGVRTEVIGCQGRELKGWEAENWGIRIKIDQYINSIRPDDYGGVIIPGGPLHSDHLRSLSGVQQFIHELFSAGRIIGTLGHGIQVLISSNLLRGLRIAAPPTLVTDVKHSGALVTAENVVADNGLITARDDRHLDAFARCFLDTLRAGIRQRAPAII